MKRNRGFAVCAAGCLLLALCACTATEAPAPADGPAAGSAGVPAEVQYDYQLKAGEVTELYDVTFEKMVTVTVDPDSTRDGTRDLRSDLFFDNCTFHGGLTIVGDYHAMIGLGGGCSFEEGTVVSCKAVTPDAAKNTTLEDNRVKLLVSCEGVCVETEAAVGVLTDGPDVTVNGTAYSKAALAPEAALLGIYNIYEGDAITYAKLAISEEEDVVFLD